MFSAQSFQGSIAFEAWNQTSVAAGSPVVSFGFATSSSHNPPTFARAPNQAIQQGGFGEYAVSGSAGFNFAMVAPSYGSGQGKAVVAQSAFGAPAAGGAAFGGQGFIAQAAAGQPFGGTGKFIGVSTPLRLAPTDFGRVAPQDEDND